MKRHEVSRDLRESNTQSGWGGQSLEPSICCPAVYSNQNVRCCHETRKFDHYSQQRPWYYSFLLQSFKVKLGKLKAWAALEFVANWTRTYSFAHYFVIVIMVSSAPKNSSEQPQGYRPKWLHYLAEPKYVWPICVKFAASRKSLRNPSLANQNLTRRLLELWKSSEASLRLGAYWC